MTVLASADFDSLGNNVVVAGYTAGNELGGSGTRAFITPSGGVQFSGNGAGGVDAANDTAINLLEVIGANKARIRINPNGATNNLAIWGRRNNNATGSATGVLILFAGQTSLRASSMAAGTRTDHATTVTTAPGTTFLLEIDVDPTAQTLTGRVLNNDLSVRNTVTHTFGGSVPSGGDYWGWSFFGSGFAAIFDDLIIDDGASGDTTDPILTSVSGTDTGSTSATVSVSSTEAGPGWAVLTASSTQPNDAQVKAGQDHTGSTSGVFGDTATLAIGSNPGAFVFTGLTPGATYWPHVVSDDTATPTANTSAVESGPSFTMPAPDLTDPVFADGTTLDAGTKTNSSIALSTSAVATDNIAVTGYEWSSDNGATYPFTSLTNSFTFTALADLTSYNFRVRAYDGAGNRSAHLSLTASTYRAGDTGQNIRDNTGPVGGNPEGFLYNKVVLPADAAKWFSYVITTPPATGAFDTLNPDGTFVFTGPATETMYVQLEVDGANFDAPFLVTLYDAAAQLATPSNAVSTGTATRSSAIQTFEATAVSATSIGTATRSAATPPTAVPVQPVNAVSTGTATRSFVRSLSRARAASWTRYPAGTAQSTYPLR